MTIPWYRLSIDLDRDGNWRGASYEVYDETLLVKVHVQGEPGPFDSPAEILAAMVEDIERRYGTQLRLL